MRGTVRIVHDLYFGLSVVSEAACELAELIGAEVLDSCGNSWTGETPEAHRQPRGKRAPAAEINHSMLIQTSSRMNNKMKYCFN
ncbi:hypothetical protein CN378_22025 [Bacillus sp. AFS015802]|uniref:hypothetical protein n=1 Tax=Bacillus sp. AFS015802 TaxID=2033486 RepID=UPI000BF88B2A|nr:hypothetical protein [Bacillus sp. AFS015802]PFA61865.1 hypothetical protein CN378_22025 [Bacillus sp. AFS015802]